MPAEVNGNHAVAHFDRARVYTYNGERDVNNQYYVCGSVVLTPFFAFVSGHGNGLTDHEPVVSIAIPREDIRLVVDHSVEACETHDQMDAEAKAQMESLQNAEESTEN